MNIPSATLQTRLLSKLCFTRNFIFIASSIFLSPELDNNSPSFLEIQSPWLNLCLLPFSSSLLTHMLARLAELSGIAFMSYLVIVQIFYTIRHDCAVQQLIRNKCLKIKISPSFKAITMMLAYMSVLYIHKTMVYLNEKQYMTMISWNYVA